jgi:hypothetical protein
MKKKYYIIAVVYLISLGAAAQPIITHNGNAPQIGDSYNYSGDNGSYDPGPAGANQTWDFSGITPTFSSSLTAVNPGSTPFAGDFPEATIAFAQSGDNETFIYSQISASEMLNVGLGNIPGGGGNELIIHYTDPVKLMQYPFSYNNTYSDSYYTAYSYMEGMVIHEWGTITVTADAWGSVTTPEGTYHNTLRVKSERTYTDSIWVSGVFVSANTYTQSDYGWHTATSHSPVISISITSDGITATYRTDALGIGEERLSKAQINVYPNPAVNSIHAELPEGSDITSDIYIFDLNGRQVAQLRKTGTCQFSADISQLVPGEYVIKVINSSVKYTATKFIKTTGY